MPRPRTIALSFAAFLLFVSALLAWYRFWPGPRRVDSGIFELDRVLTAQAGFIWRARFSPDGSRIVSASTGGTAVVWRLDGTIVRVLTHPAGVTAAEFSPDGKNIATTSYDGAVRIWDLASGALRRTITVGPRTLWCLAFSPDGSTIATAGEDGIVQLLNVADGSSIRTLAGHRRNIWAVTFSPDGKKLVSASFDHTAILWSIPDGTRLHTLEGHLFGLVAANFSPDGREVVTGSDDGTARTWNVEDGSPVRTFADGPYHVYAARFSPDGTQLLLAGKDRPALGELLQEVLGATAANKWVTAQLRDATTGAVLQTFSEHANDINDASFSPDGRWIVTASEDQTLDLWHRTSTRK